MPGYCGICNQHYSGHYTDHDDECLGGEQQLPERMTPEERFQYEKSQQNWPDEMDEEIYNEHFRP